MKQKIAHILLVEDNEGDIVLTLEAFEDSDIKTHISVVRNGKEALDFLLNREQFANADRPDLVLLDINIPIYNGHEVMDEINNTSRLKGLPIIILTTSSNQKDKIRAQKNGCQRYYLKPMDMATFYKIVDEIGTFLIDEGITEKK